jgi:hypothetical protein
VIPYVDSRLRAWVSFRVVSRRYYAYRTVLGDLRSEETARATGTAPGASRTRALTWPEEDREPLEVELVVRYLPEPMTQIALLAYAGVSTLDELADLQGPPHPMHIPQLEAALGVCRRTVYNRLDSLHARILDALNEPKLDDLVQHIARQAALDTLGALAQNTRHSAKVGKAAAAA